MGFLSKLWDKITKGGDTKPDVDMKTYGPMGSTAGTGAFDDDPLGRAEEPETGRGIDTGEVRSADPEEGGEVSPS